MRHTLRIICCVSAHVFLYSAVSIAEPDALERKTILEIGDVDGDGTLNLAELQGVVPYATQMLFERLDTDGDGRLSTKDWHWKIPRTYLKNDFPRLFRADANNDQKVTFEEAVSRYEHMTPSEFVRIDGNSDGTITRGEYSNTLRRPQGDAIRRVIDDFLLADVDNDGKVTWEEIRARAPEYPRPVFDWLDLDADDMISESDYRRPSRRP